jgi:3-deoxy-D-manno-octulosonate 8-phosphate phosphatase (KDO 8-P phosphatase)
MKDVRLIAFDVDGTLTDGGVYFGPHGEEHKRFNIADGLGFRLALSAGFKLGIVSGRKSEQVRNRMEALGVTEILQGIDNKRDALLQLMAKHDLAPEQVAFVGDDINDIPAFEAVGVKIAVANAVQYVKNRADYVTHAFGGNGAGREAIEAILTAQGRLEAALEQYIAEISGEAPPPVIH